MRKSKVKLLLIIVTIFLIVLIMINMAIQNVDDSKNKFDEVINVEETSNELFSDYYDEAEKIMEGMSIENKISQLFIIDYRTPLYGNDPSYIGGMILYGDFFSYNDVESAKAYVNTLQNQSKLKYAIAVDEEGGTVSRISSYKQFRSSIFLSPNKLYKKGGLDLILETEDEKDKLILSMNINLNLAPVADVSTDSNDFMYDRTLGVDAEETATYIAEVTKKAKENGLATCLKHFPGYGNNEDTHIGVVTDTRDLSVFLDSDFKPFIAGIEAGTPFIMMSHNIMASVDSEYPASLSKKVIDILKEDLNYSGIIMSDDIAMYALLSYNIDDNVATLALEAGNDMIMSSNYSAHYRELVNAYNNGVITEERINYSVRKIIAWKLAYGIIES